jgi:hypothetical protein
MTAIATIMKQAVNGVALERGPSREVTLLGYLMLFSWMGYWLEKDSREHQMAWIFDMDYFCTWHGLLSCLSIYLKPVV